MKRSEAEAILKHLKARQKWIKDQLKRVRSQYGSYLTRCLPEDIAPPDRDHFHSNHIDLIRWSSEEDVLKKEIERLERALER